MCTSSTAFQIRFLAFLWYCEFPDGQNCVFAVFISLLQLAVSCVFVKWANRSFYCFRVKNTWCWQACCSEKCSRLIEQALYLLSPTPAFRFYFSLPAPGLSWIHHPKLSPVTQTLRAFIPILAAMCHSISSIPLPYYFRRKADRPHPTTFFMQGDRSEADVIIF